VNLLNQRALENAERVAERELQQAELAVAASQGGLTHFREGERDIDPERSSSAQITLATTLKGQLAQAKAQLAAIAAAVDQSSPQYTAQVQRVRALQAQADAATAKMTAGSGSMAPTLSAYESLRIRQDFAAKRYEAAASALQNAREQAQRQQLYVVRLVEPNLPVKALFPQRWVLLLSVFCTCLLIYGIGTLILAGVREHAL
jgi:capsular polysaccharide transport system permease protein